MRKGVKFTNRLSRANRKSVFWAGKCSSDVLSGSYGAQVKLWRTRVTSQAGGHNSSGLTDFEKLLINIEIGWESARSMPFRAKTELRPERWPLTAKTGKPLSRRKWTRKSTIKGTVALTGAKPLRRHQLKKSIHFAWYNREVDMRTQPDISTADPREKPDFRRRRWRAATHEGSARGRRCGICWSGAAATTGSTTEAPLAVGSVEGYGLRTTPTPARGGDQSHGEIGGLSDSSHHPFYQRKGWKRIQVQVGPRMTKRILKDCLGIRDKGTV